LRSPLSDKLLRAVWAIMKKGEKYQFNYDEKVKMKYQSFESEKSLKVIAEGNQIGP